MKKNIGLLTLISLIMGCLFGLFFKDASLSIEFIGTYYIKILKLFITPLLFTCIALTIYKTSKKKETLVIKSIIIFILMFLLTFIITSLIVLLINPSEGFMSGEMTWNGNTTEFNLLNTLLNILPKNLSDIFVNPKVFFVIVIAYIFGSITSHFKFDKFYEYLEKFKELLFKIFEIIVYVTPIATFSLIASTISKNGTLLLGTGLKYILTAYLAAIVTLFVVMILPVKLISNIGVLEYIKKVYKIWIMTISTCSSAATLPYTVKLCNEEFDIPSATTDVVVPLGCTIHMCGGAVSFALLGLFCLKMYGIELNLYLYLMMILASLLINMAAPGIPGGGIVIGASYLQIFGVPLGFIGFYSGIYKLLDMCYTTLNVTGDISANIIINTLNEKEKKA